MDKPSGIKPPPSYNDLDWNLDSTTVIYLYKRDKSQPYDATILSQFYNDYLNVWQNVFDNPKFYCAAKWYRQKKIFAFKIEVHMKDKYLDIDRTIDESGAGDTKKVAKAMACVRLVKAIKDAGFNHQMPYQVIGLPNYRGHCFVVPTLVPFFNDNQFCEAMHKLRLLITGNRDELKFCSRFCELFQTYLNVSKLGQIELDAVPTGLEKKKGHEVLKPLAKYCRKRSGKKPCLSLDRNLMNLIAILSTDIDEDYAGPGGFHFNLCHHLLFKVAYELETASMESPFEPLTHSTVEYTYDCDKGCWKDANQKKQMQHFCLPMTPYFTEENNLQDMIDSPESYFFPDFTCEKVGADGTECGANVTILDANIVKLSHFLIIIFDDTYKVPHNMEQVYLPQTIIVKSSISSHLFEKYAISFISELPEDECQPGQLPEDSLHTYVVLKTFNEWIEVNNNTVTTCTDDIYHATGSNMVIYRRKPDQQVINYPRWSC